MSRPGLAVRPRGGVALVRCSSTVACRTRAGAPCAASACWMMLWIAFTCRSIGKRTGVSSAPSASSVAIRCAISLGQRGVSGEVQVGVESWVQRFRSPDDCLGQLDRREPSGPELSACARERQECDIGRAAQRQMGRLDARSIPSSPSSSSLAAAVSSSASASLTRSLRPSGMDAIEASRAACSMLGLPAGSQLRWWRLMLAPTPLLGGEPNHHTTSSRFHS